MSTPRTTIHHPPGETLTGWSSPAALAVRIGRAIEAGRRFTSEDAGLRMRLGHENIFVSFTERMSITSTRGARLRTRLHWERLPTDRTDPRAELLELADICASEPLPYADHAMATHRFAGIASILAKEAGMRATHVLIDPPSPARTAKVELRDGAVAIPCAEPMHRLITRMVAPSAHLKMEGRTYVLCFASAIMHPIHHDVGFVEMARIIASLGCAPGELFP